MNLDGEQPRAFFQDGAAVIAVVEQLEFGTFAIQVGDAIFDRELVRANARGDSRAQPQGGAEHHGFIDIACDGDRAVGGDFDRHVSSGRVRDLSVEGQEDVGFIPVVVDDDISTRGAVVVETTTDDPLVEALEPPETTSIVQVDESRVHRIFDG